MCLAIPGKVIEISKDEATIEYPSETRKAKLFGLDIVLGDYVFVQGGFVVEKIPEKEALESLEAWKEML